MCEVFAECSELFEDGRGMMQLSEMFLKTCVTVKLVHTIHLQRHTKPSAPIPGSEHRGVEQVCVHRQD